MTRFVTPESTTHAFRSNARVKLLHKARVIALSNRAGIRQTRSYGSDIVPNLLGQVSIHGNYVYKSRGFVDMIVCPTSMRYPSGSRM
jgi:hypothetical protein